MHAKRIRSGEMREYDPEWGIEPNPKCIVDGCAVPRYTRKGPHCRGHYGRYLMHGDLQKRAKRSKFDPPATCSDPNCGREAVCKGMCSAHYSRFLTQQNPNRTRPCSVAGCQKQTTRGMCASHRQQFERHGTTWVGERPVEEIKAIREAQKRRCAVPECSQKERSVGSGLCQRHGADFGRKGCTLEFYLELMSIKACEACGSAGPLVTDHDHSHPHGKDKMCSACIRGRLCNGCNTALGYLKESQERVAGLARYLETHCGVPRAD